VVTYKDRIEELQRMLEAQRKVNIELRRQVAKLAAKLAATHPRSKYRRN
jgi:uncharacterized coiled-coil protein SlyX